MTYFFMHNFFKKHDEFNNFLIYELIKILIIIFIRKKKIHIYDDFLHDIFIFLNKSIIKIIIFIQNFQ